MRTIAALNLLLRARVELPEGLSLATEEFREGWNFSRSVGVGRLEKKILNRGWNFIKIDGVAQKAGVGDTSQEAIASALMLALRRVGSHFNAVEVEHIELTQYPWFFLARVRVNPYRIQQAEASAARDEAAPRTVAPRQRWLPRQPAELYPNSAGTMPMLKEMLTLSGKSHGRAK